MYSYTFDETTGGLLLNSTPTLFSKEPRPVYAKELDILGFDKYWVYDKQNDVPYMWAESTAYWYRGKLVARIKGGNIYTAPEIILSVDEDGNIIMPEDNNAPLRPVDIGAMVNANRDLMTLITRKTEKGIVDIYEKYRNKLDIFHVAFSGGKDSTVLLDLVKKALPHRSFVVIFGDTKMEFPDTYVVIEKIKKMCDVEDIPFYTASSELDPIESWQKFGPPSRILRWCCSVFKSAPQTLKLREITGKDNYVGLDFVGVRKHESFARSQYKEENFGEKQKGQYSHNSILEWTSAEIWLYIYMNDLVINEAYKNGNSRVGCLLCPMGGGKGDYFQHYFYPASVDKYISVIQSMNQRNDNDDESLQSYVMSGGWNARKNGRDLADNEQRFICELIGEKYVISVKSPNSNWREWIKTIPTIPFDYEIFEEPNEFKIAINSSSAKAHPTEFRLFKQVFIKATYCIGCKVCESNCRNGCITFTPKLMISNCVHCECCFSIPKGCLLYHSRNNIVGDGIMNKSSINSFANHAPKLDWVNKFFCNDDYLSNNELGKDQKPMFKRFLRECGLIDVSNEHTAFFKIIKKIGWESEVSWALILSNFVQNPQFAWYVKNMGIGYVYKREEISDLLIACGVKKDDATSIINSYKRFCDLPIGYALKWGYANLAGKQIQELVRTKCYISDPRVVLYALCVFVSECNYVGRELNLSVYYEDDENRDYISPVNLFGLTDRNEFIAMLRGLTSRYPDLISTVFTNDLELVTVKCNDPTLVLKMFEEE